ncbi:hypothetical protein ACFVDH_17870 [Streptomyces sp. NPDC057674]|uniref:hypothetical protein n=1 Tax=Streptomyces sp. NPDC057674 TaxID=3346203 RepID=UPI0036B39309
MKRLAPYVLMCLFGVVQLYGMRAGDSATAWLGALLCLGVPAATCALGLARQKRGEES